MKTKNADSFNASMGRGSELYADRVFVGFMPSLRFGLRAQVWILLFCNSDDEHHLVMGPDDVPIDPLGLRVHWAPSVVKLLCRLMSPIRLSIPFHYIVIWGAALARLSIRRSFVAMPGSHGISHKRLGCQGALHAHDEDWVRRINRKSSTVPE